MPFSNVSKNKNRCRNRKKTFKNVKKRAMNIKNVNTFSRLWFPRSSGTMNDLARVGKLSVGQGRYCYVVLTYIPTL